MIASQDNPLDLQWRIDTPEQTMVLCSENSALPAVLYWGRPLAPDEDLESLAKACEYDINSGTLDTNATLSICPQVCQSFPGKLGLIARNSEGKLLWPSFKLIQQNQDQNKLTLTFKDEALGLFYILIIKADSHNNVLALTSSVNSEQSIFIDWLAAPVLPAPQNATHSLELSGRWCGEFQLNKVEYITGCRTRENTLGRTSHEHFPALIIPTEQTTNNSGNTYTLHYAYSGGHKMYCEQLSDGRRQIQFGHARQSNQVLVNSSSSATLYATFSSKGLNGTAKALQGHVRDKIINYPDTQKPRPIHYNCWEAIYFDHNIEQLKEIANHAANLGVERFVLDDGWFKNRNDDQSSLGDWFVDSIKYPNGLDDIIQHIEALKMGFGLWFEPEMISEDSDLYRQHPQWVLGPINQVRGRQQLVLDMNLTAVQNYLFERISSLLSEYSIEYIKWDHNRVLPNVDAAQTSGVYHLLDRLRDAHPNVEIESCSSGGGRIDFEILKRTHRIWLSDSNDAIERFKIQNNAALFFPCEVTGSHIGPQHCHTSGRELPISFRAWVAASRHMGLEMDPRELSASDIDEIKKATSWYKTNRQWLHKGFIQRLDCDDTSILGEIQVAQDESQFVVFVCQMETSDQVLPKPIRLCGLKDHMKYDIRLLNPHSCAPTSRGNPILKEHNITVSGRFLMERGLSLPVAFPATIWIIEGKLA